MLTIKLLAGGLAATVLAGTGIERLTSSGDHVSTAETPGVLEAPVAVTASIYAPIAALPAWVQQWKGDPALRLGSGLPINARPRAVQGSPILVASAVTPPATHPAAHAGARVIHGSSLPIHVAPASHSVTTVRTSKSANGGTTRTRTTTRTSTSSNGTTRRGTHTQTTVKSSGTHPVKGKPVSKPAPVSKPPGAPAPAPTTGPPTPAPAATTTTASPTKPGPSDGGGNGGGGDGGSKGGGGNGGGNGGGGHGGGGGDGGGWQGGGGNGGGWGGGNAGGGKGGD